MLDELLTLRNIMLKQLLGFPTLTDDIISIH